MNSFDRRWARLRRGEEPLELSLGKLKSADWLLRVDSVEKLPFVSSSALMSKCFRS